MKSLFAWFLAASLLVSATHATDTSTPAPPPPPEASTKEGRRPWLGVFLGDALDGGVQLVEVVAEGPAGRAGLESGDIVLRLNDRPVENRVAADAAIQALRPGDEVRVRVVRGGHVEDRIVVVGHRATWFMPKMEAPGAWEFPGGPGQQVLGLRWVDISEELRIAWGAPKDAGVVVARIAPEGAAAKAGVKVGDVVVRVNGAPLASADEVPYLSSSSPVRLEIVRRGSSRPLALELTPVATPAPSGAPRALQRALDDAERRRLETEIERLQQEVKRLSEELKRERSAQ